MPSKGARTWPSRRPGNDLRKGVVRMETPPQEPGQPDPNPDPQPEEPTSKQ